MLTLIFVLIGAYSIAAQIYFIRELLVVFLGNELCIGIIFSGWFAGIGIGSCVGGKIRKKTDHVIPVFLVFVVLLCLLPFLLIPVMRVVRAIFEVPPGGYASAAHIAAATFISITPFSFMVGVVFPLACRVLIGNSSRGSIEIGWVYIWESAGSLAGGIIISFLLIPMYPPMVVFAWGCLLIFSTSFLLACYVRQGSGFLKALLFFLSLVVLIVIIRGSPRDFDRYLEKLRWNTFQTGLKLIVSRDSQYQNIVLAEAQEQYGIFGNGILSGTYPDEYQSALRAHFFLSEHPDPGRVLLIGGGITGFLKEMLKHPVKSVDYVELDPEFVRIIYPFLKPGDKKAVKDRRVEVFHMDGRRFVKEAGGKYDLVIVLTPDPSTALLNRFYTVDFFNEVRKILSDKGVLIIGMSSTANYISREIADYNGSLYAGLSNVFPFVMVVPGERNYFFAGTADGLFTKDPGVLSMRYEKRNINTENFSPLLFEWLLQKDRIEFLENALTAKKDLHINTDFHPVTYFYNLVLWDMLSGEKGEIGFFRDIKEKGVWCFYIAIVLIFLSGCMGFLVKNREIMIRFSCLWAIGTTGYAGMAMEMVLVFMFQSFFGYIYEKIGVVVALFMMGIAVGSLFMRRWLKRSQFVRFELLITLEIIIFAYAAASPFILSLISKTANAGITPFFLTEYFYFVLIFVIALFTGMEFPLVCHLLISSGCESGSTAGSVDAADHFGACFGSFLTGVVLLPLFGIQNTCFFIALLKLTCVGFLVINLRRGLAGAQ